MKCFESVKHNGGDNYLIRKSNKGKQPARRASSRGLAQKQSRGQPGGALLTPNLLFSPDPHCLPPPSGPCRL